jgi:hypothetical protein
MKGKGEGLRPPPPDASPRLGKGPRMTLFAHCELQHDNGAGKGYKEKSLCISLCKGRTGREGGVFPMTDPQPVEAHLRIAHSIEEQIMVSLFSEQELRVLFFILRLSWGCGKRSAYIPKQRDFEIIGIGEGHIKSRLDWLISSKVIFRDGCFYAFNKNFDDWRVSRARGYRPEVLTQLVSVNLSTPDKEFTQNVSHNLPKREESTYAKGKSPEPEPASPKERLNKYIYKDNQYLDISSGVAIDVAQTFPREAAEIWSKVLSELKTEISAANFRTWLEKTAGLGYYGIDFIVGTNSRQATEYLSSNMRSLLEKTLIGVSTRDFKITFVEFQTLS